MFDFGGRSRLLPCLYCGKIILKGNCCLKREMEDFIKASSNEDLTPIERQKLRKRLKTLLCNLGSEK